MGVCGSLGGVGVSWGVGPFVAGVCGLPGVGGGESLIVGASVAGVCGFWGWGGDHFTGPGDVRAGRVWATGWGVGREGLGVWGGVRVWCFGVHVRSRSCASVVSCRSRGLEVKFAVHRGCGEDFADVCAHLVYVLVGGGERAL